jgi:uncharacterized protein
LKKITLLLICLLCGSVLFAQKNPQATKAEKLLSLVSSPESQAQLIESTLDQQIDANPQIAPYRDIMSAFLNKYLGYEAIKADIVKLYMTNFSEKELDELIKFYESPIGRKSADLMPKLFQEGANIGQQKVTENLSELQAEIQKAAAAQ